MFGNTREVAEEIANGVHEELPAAGALVVEVSQAPHRLPEDLDLLLVGGPTHAFSMTRESTRADAVRQGADRAGAGTGIREWIEAVLPQGDLPVLTFDTRVRVRGLPGSAARSAAKALRRRGFARVERGRTFWVGGADGPLDDAERRRARARGRELAARVPRR